LEEDKGFEYFEETPDIEKKIIRNPTSDPVKHIEDEALESIPSLDTITKRKPSDYVFGVDEIKPTTNHEPEETDHKPARSKQGMTFPIVEEKKKMRVVNVVLILVFLILVIGGVILLLLPWLESEPTVDSMKGKEKKATDTVDIIKLEEPKPVAEGATKTEDQKGKTEEQKTKETGQPQTTTQTQTPTQTQTQVPEKNETKSAESYFKEGSLTTAGDVWKKELGKAGVKYTILLEMDCKKESVVFTYNRLPDKKGFFIINKRSQNRICYLVMWGKFFTNREASDAMKSVPNYFWQQKEPPEVVELSKYY
jgi:septal ring-binding cell division protein DamX